MFNFDMQSKKVIELLAKYFDDQKKHMTALEENELDVIFETFTQENQVENFDAYFATAKQKEEKPQEKAHSVRAFKAGEVWENRGY